MAEPNLAVAQAKLDNANATIINLESEVSTSKEKLSDVESLKTTIIDLENEVPALQGALFNALPLAGPDYAIIYGFKQKPAMNGKIVRKIKLNGEGWQVIVENCKNITVKSSNLLGLDVQTAAAPEAGTTGAIHMHATAVGTGFDSG